MKSDSAVRLKFQISTRKRRNGFTLHSPLLLFPLQYETLNEAVNYACFLARDAGCEIDIRDSNGTSIDALKVDARHNRWINPPRLTGFAKRLPALKLYSKRPIKKHKRPPLHVAFETT